MKPALSAFIGVGLLAWTAGVAPAVAQGPAPAPPSEGPAAPSAPQMPPAPPAPPAAVARLVDPRNPLVRGEALLQQTGPNLTAVVVTVYGLEPGSTHISHIHAQSCAGPIRFPLRDLVADSSGTARAVSQVPAALNVEDWYINVHASYQLPSPGITCGKVLPPPMPAPPPGPPPAAPQAPPAPER